MLRDQIKECRKGKNLSIEDLARDLHFSPEQIKNWERGTAFPNSTQLFNLANYFQTTATDLLDEGDDIYLTADIEEELVRLSHFMENQREQKKKGVTLLLSLVTILFLFHVVAFVAIWATFNNTDAEYTKESQIIETQEFQGE